MNKIDGIEFNFHLGIISIAGQDFPACVVLHDLCSFYDEACISCHRKNVGACVSGGNTHTADFETWDGGWDVYVPAENGALFCIEYGSIAPFYGGGYGLTLTLARPVSHKQIDSDGTTWLLEYLEIKGRTLVDSNLFKDHGPWIWNKVEPEWLAETILRLSRYELSVLPLREDQKPVRYLSINHPSVRPTTW